jgi:hypothetical protein
MSYTKVMRCLDAAMVVMNWEIARRQRKGQIIVQFKQLRRLTKHAYQRKHGVRRLKAAMERDGG